MLAYFCPIEHLGLNFISFWSGCFEKYLQQLQFALMRDDLIIAA